MQTNALSLLVFILLALPLPASALCLFCSCTVATTPVAFGTYDPTSSTPLNSDGSILLTCSGLVGALITYNVSVSKGVNSASFSPRRMASGANRLDYDLYTSSAYSSVWGDGSGGTQTVSGNLPILLLAGTTRNIPIYGRIPGGQPAVRPGAYSDAVVITVTYD